MNKSIGNRIFLNNFIDNTYNAYSDSSNTWSSTSPVTYTYNENTYTNYIGNYWSDYEGSDANGDGIGETPYSIMEDDYDNYPLIEPWKSYIPEGGFPPTVNITRPENALYFRDKSVISSPLPIIIGPITIEVDAIGIDGFVEKVEFYVDNALRYTDTVMPFSWRWNEKAFGFKVIKVVAYDNEGKHQQSLKEVFILNYPPILQ